MEMMNPNPFASMPVLDVLIPNFSGERFQNFRLAAPPRTIALLLNSPAEAGSGKRLA
jgi:hypothetical protein